MERRDFLFKSFRKHNSKNTSSPPPTPPPSDAGIDPYTGVWDKQHVSQFLRRTLFGPTYAQILEVEANGLAQTIIDLLTDTDPPSPPIHYEEEDAKVAMGETWVDTELPLHANNGGIGTENLDAKRARLRSLDSWVFQNINNQGVSLIGKMNLFWQNHFVTADVKEARYIYKYNTTIRQYSLGNFSDFVKAITIEPAMLRYLNGRDNKKQSPNENYARELLELFTIGKGPQINQGDYTHYTEDNIVEIAKVLTGWKDFGANSAIAGVEPVSLFQVNDHDETQKDISSHFSSDSYTGIIDNEGENEVNVLIDTILAKDEVSRFIVRQIYTWFMFSEITETVEENVIEPLALIFRDNNYEIKPVLETFLLSEHFNDFENHGAIIKSPIDFVMSFVNQFELTIPVDSLYPTYHTNFRYRTMASQMGMDYLNPPSVAGWSAYFQEPGFYRSWLNSFTLVRMQFLRERLILNGYLYVANTEYENEAFHYEEFRLKVDRLKFISTLSDSANVDSLIEDSLLVLLPKPLTTSQIEFVKTEFLDGMTDDGWADLYNSHLANPDDVDIANLVSVKIRNFLLIVTRFPEYLLI